MIEKYGIDTVRLYILFKAPPEVPLYWSEAEIVGPFRWLLRLHQLASQISSETENANEENPSNSIRLIEAFNDALEKVFMRLLETAVCPYYLG